LKGAKVASKTSKGDCRDCHPSLSEICALSRQIRRKGISVIDLDYGDGDGTLDKDMDNGSFLSRTATLSILSVEEDFEPELRGSDWIRF